MPTWTRTAFRSLPVLVPIASLAAGCAVGADRDGKVAARVSAVAADYPELGFDPRPDYIPDNVIVLTFDDGPEWNGYTTSVLDTLRDKDVKATFFINTENWSNVNQDAPMQAIVRRIVDEGHELASHSVAHPHLPTLSAQQIEDQLAGVESTTRNVIGPNAPRITLFRAPFGEPYQDRNGYDLVAPIVAQHAVHIGWNLDVFDYNCPAGDSGCVLNNFRNGVKTPGQGAWGIVLMHSVNAQTPAALGQIIDYARDNGFQFWTTEQVVCARFGKSSGHVVDGTSGNCETTTTPPPDAGVPNPGTPDAGDPSGDDPNGDDPNGDDPNGDDPNGDDPSGDGPSGDTPGTGGTTGGCVIGGRGDGAWGGLALLAPLAFLLVRRRRARR